MDKSQSSQTSAKSMAIASTTSGPQQIQQQQQQQQQDVYYREQMERILKDSKLLQSRIQILEAENGALKKSVFDLSTRLNDLIQPPRSSSPNVGGPSMSGGGVGAIGTASRFYVPPFFGIPDSDLSSHHPHSHSGHSNDAVSPGGGVGGDHTALTTSDHGPFRLQYELAGHSGAVYSVKYSPCGRWLASSSFDKTVRVWNSNSTECVAVLDKHAMSVSCLAWHYHSNCSATGSNMDLLTGSYDKTCRRWDVNTWQCVDSFPTDGFVQCIHSNPANENIFFYGTTRKVACLVDKRKKDPAVTISIDAMVNALHVYSSGTRLMTGDSSGYLKTWDIRNMQCLRTTLNDPKHHAISCISMCHANADDTEDEPRYMAINSYDDVIRVYDRGWTVLRNPLTLLHSLRGHRNRNWPIQSAFYTGDIVAELGADFEFVQSQADDSDHHRGHKKSPRTLLLATGSSTASAYSYILSRTPSVENTITDTETFLTKDASLVNLKLAAKSQIVATSTNDEIESRKNSIHSLSQAHGRTNVKALDEIIPGHVQSLDGHKDRVYSVAYHPKQLMMASSSADFRICVWKARSQRLSNVLKQVLDVRQ